jgi:mRNA interferase RelE/StbE
MNITISSRAEKELRKIGKMDQIALAKKIRSLASTDIFRVRIGIYRIVFRKTKEEIYIILIGHRKDIYQKVKQLLGK